MLFTAEVRGDYLGSPTEREDFHIKYVRNFMTVIGW